MGASNMTGGSNFDASTAAYDRQNRTNPPAFAPGQDGVFQSQDAFAQSAVQNNPGQVGDIFSTGAGMNMSMGIPDPNNPFSVGVGASPNGGIPMGNTMQMQPAQPQKSQEDMLFEAVKSGAKGTFNIFKELADSVPMLTPRWFSEWGKTVALTGIILAVVGIILRLVGWGSGFQLAIGSLVATAMGVVQWMFLAESAKPYTSKYKDENNTNATMVQQNPAEQTMNFDNIDSFSQPSSDWGSTSDGGFSDEDDWGVATEYDADDDDPYGLNDSDEDYYEVEEAQDGMNTEDALNSLPQIPRGMYERSYLWDMFTKKLPTMKPGFAEMRDIDESEDTFLAWEDRLREAAGVTGCKEDFLPDLLQLQENLFTVIVTCNRPQGFKSEAVANELANIYAYSSGEKNENVFAKVDNIGAECRITIFNGASAMISLKDMMLQEKDFFLDSKNYMPVALGVDQMGKVITVDLKKLESIIVTGMPRSGKSWFVQAILTQMGAFVSPRELHFYIGDPKEGISDFKAFTLPHVKKFVSEDGKIVDMLRHLVKVEGPRRKKIIGDAGFVNIWDYKSRYPDVNIPIIYVIIDEIVTLASRMDKETNNEFRMLLRELISQLPALGIRAFLIPHVLNNDIIEKKTSDLVPCKISVKGNADHIEKATGSKPKDFPYKLVNAGDMAVKLANLPNTIYVHGPALTMSNPENNELFDYLRRAWAILEPDETSSISEAAELEIENRRAINNLEDASEDIQVWTNSNERGLSGMRNDFDPDDFIE